MCLLNDFISCNWLSIAFYEMAKSFYVQIMAFFVRSNFSLVVSMDFCSFVWKTCLFLQPLTGSSSVQRSGDGMMKSNPKLADESFEEEDDEHSETLCGSCGGNYNADEFWIGCDICERWFHGKCVKITPAKAENIKQYKCPSCSLKRSRQQWSLRPARERQIGARRLSG